MNKFFRVTNFRNLFFRIAPGYLSRFLYKTGRFYDFNDFICQAKRYYCRAKRYERQEILFVRQNRIGDIGLKTKD